MDKDRNVVVTLDGLVKKIAALETEVAELRKTITANSQRLDWIDNRVLKP